MQRGGYNMNKIREIAEKNNITITAIRKSADLSKSFIYDIINERSHPTIPIAQKIAKSLNSTLDEVFPSN
jgi:DNA-binding XRE family transcriptional regulator